MNINKNLSNEIKVLKDRAPENIVNDTKVVNYNYNYESKTDEFQYDNINIQYNLHFHF